MGVNKVILVGNVGKDPEIQYVSENIPVARFTLATSETYKDKNGEKVTNTEWHNIVVWRGLAQVVEKYVKKGTQLYIEGKITHRQYEKDGVTKYFTEIVANNMQMLSRVGETLSTSEMDNHENTPETKETLSDPENNQETTETLSEPENNQETIQSDDANLDDLPF